jgi:hypothetical protein
MKLILPGVPEIKRGACKAPLSCGTLPSAYFFVATSFARRLF